MITPKELKRLAKACRQAGIKSFKSKEFEFTLTEEPPPPSYYLRTKKKEQSSPPITDSIQSEGDLTEEQLLFWSGGGILPGDTQIGNTL